MLARLLLAVAASALLSPALVAEDLPPAATIPAGVPLRVALDHRYSIRTGTRVEGRLTSAVYLVDHVVLPVDTPVYGVVVGRHPVKKSIRINALLDGDFTPLAVPEVRFDALQLPDGSLLQFSAPAIERDAVTVRMTSATADTSVRGRLKTEFAARRQEMMGSYVSKGRVERLEQYFYKMLPYHPQNLWTGQQFDANLQQPLAVPQPASQPASLPLGDFAAARSSGVLEARLTRNLTSATCPAGMPIEAVLSKPLFDEKREHLLLPEGTVLTGSIVESHRAAMFGRNGHLRFTFRKVEMPENTATIHGILVGAESAPGQNLSIDSEGGTRASSPNPALGTLALAVLAAASHGDDGGTPLNAAIVSNGFALVGRLASVASGNKNVASGFAYYALGKNIYRRYIARGKDVVFPQNTRVQIELAER